MLLICNIAITVSIIASDSYMHTVDDFCLWDVCVEKDSIACVWLKIVYIPVFALF